MTKKSNMAETQASSRLEVLQARFQQKQMQEKEQKLLHLYDQQQQRAYQVVQRGSAGSTGSVPQQHSVVRTTTTTHTTSTSQAGKVRQMFDERRQTPVKGIDRSYPLEPLDNKPKRQIAIANNGHIPSKANQGSTVTRQSVTVRRTARADVNSSINGGKPIVSYQEEVQFGNENHNGKYQNGDDSNANQTRVHIEEILSDDTIERNRMLAKIHLMEYDENLRHRVNTDLNNEQFPHDLMLDVPDKLPRKNVARKLSQAEARLERFKNANAKRNNASVTLRKRSEPMFPSSRTTSRDSTMKSKPTETIKVNRSSTKPVPKPVPFKDPKPIARKKLAQDSTKTVETNSPAIILGEAAAVSKKKVEVVSPVKTTKPELVRACEPVIKSPEPSPRVQKSPSPEPADKKSTTSAAGSQKRRSFPSSPTRSEPTMTRRGSANSKSPEPRPVRKSLQRVSKNHGAVDTTDANLASKESYRTNVADNSNFVNSSESPTRVEDRKSSTRSSAASTKSIKAAVTDINGHSREKEEPTTITKPMSRKLSAERTSRTQNQRHPTPTTSPSPRPPSALSTASSTASSPRANSSAESKPRQMATKAKNPARSPATSASSTKGPSSVRNVPAPLNSDALVACKTCGRRFAQDRVSAHEKICAKTGQKKRKQFNASLHRVQGTELEAFAKKSTLAGRQTEAKKAEVNTKSNWRRKHEDFINAIRSAKQVQAHLAAGGKLSDLPPPPPSDTSHYTQCPHCGRKFNQGAAERHIPKCANMMHNKPNPRAPPKPKR